MMTRGQLAQLEDLNKCYIPKYSEICDLAYVQWRAEAGYKADYYDKWILRRLTHQYRNQIAAVKRNQRRQETRHHILCNHYMRPRAGCKMCDGLYKEFS